MKPRYLEVPDDLPHEAAVFWRTWARRLYRAGDLRRGKLERFRLLCVLVAITRAAAADLVKDGITLQTANGKKAHPTLHAFLAVQRQQLQLMKYFYL